MGCSERFRSAVAAMHANGACALGRARAKLEDRQGQATTEYAILVGVLVVIAILAITLFKPKLEELWGSIATAINGL